MAELLPQGTTVGDYRVARLIGSGGQGEVYLARDERLGRKVALKLLRGGEFESAEHIERFLSEARATARFAHPNIITIHAVGQHAGQPYVVLEYLDGENLRARLSAGRIGAMEALRIALQIAEALTEAHRRGILHRDLKPENVIIPKDGRLRVVDFGLAVRIQPPEPQSAMLESQESVAFFAEEKERGLTGTPAYMAPEQWLKQEMTTATDVFAFGVMLHEMLAGERPFQGATAAALAARVIDETPRPELTPSPELNLDLRRAIASALAQDARDRPAMKELRDLLLFAVQGRSDKSAGEEIEPPFRGLFPFRDVHTHLFFGREAEVLRAVEHLREEPILAVVGPSGAGKSSFVQAGLIPRLREQGSWRVVSFRPGRHPFHALAERLVVANDSQRSDPVDQSEQRVNELAASLRVAPERLGLRLRAFAALERVKVLLFVDQIEELSTLVPDELERSAFLRALFSAADDSGEPVRVVFTMREDFLSAIAEEPLSRDALGRVLLLRPPNAAALHEIVARPLQSTAYAFDDPKLEEEMIAAVRGEPAALPLLEFTCLALWERRDRVARTLRRSDYDTLGGVAGAIAAHAESVLGSLAPKQHELARSLLLRMVTPERTRRVEKRQELLSGLPDGAADVLDRLIDARLVTVRAGASEHSADPEVELVHEALIKSWHRLHRWIEADREDLSMLHELVQAAELWMRRGSRVDEVWTMDAIRDARSKLSRFESQLPGKAESFLNAGEKRAKRTARLRRGVVAGILIALLASSLVLYAQRERAERARIAADRAHGVSEREGAAAAMDRGEVLVARKKLRTSLEIEDSLEARALWLRLERDEPLLRTALTSPVNNLVFSRDGKRLYANQQDIGYVAVDLSRLTVETTSAASDHGPFAIAVLSDDSKIVAGMDGSITYFGASGRAQTIAAHRGLVWDIAIDPRERIFVTIGWDGSAKIFRLPGGELSHTLTHHEGRVYGLDIDQDGTRIATSSWDGRIRIFSLEHGVLLEEHRLPGRVTSVRFVPRSKSQVVSATDDGCIQLWDGKEQPERVWCAHNGRVWRLALHPNGLLLASSGIDGAVRFWTLPALNYLGEVEKRGQDLEQINAIAFSPDGRLLGIGTQEGSLEVRSIASSENPIETISDYDYNFALSRDAEKLAVGTLRGTIEIFDTANPSVRRTLIGHPRSRINSLDFSPDGRTLASLANNGLIRVFDTENGRVLSSFAVLPVSARGPGSLVFTGDGQSLAARSGERDIVVWSTTTQKLLRTIEVGAPLYDLGRFEEKTLLSTTLPNGLQAWDAETGQLIARVETGGDTRLCRSARGTRQSCAVVTGSEGTTVVRWRPGDPLRVEDRLSAFGCAAFRSTRDALITIDHLQGHEIRFEGNKRTQLPWSKALRTSTHGICQLEEGTRALLAVDRAPQVDTLIDIDRGRFLRRAIHASGRQDGTATIISNRGIEQVSLTKRTSDHELFPSRLSYELLDKAFRVDFDRAHHRACLQHYDDVVEIWDSKTDIRLTTEPAPELADLLSLGTGCLSVSKNGAVHHEAGRPPRALAPDGVALARAGSEVVVITKHGVLTFDQTLALTSSQAISIPVTAAARVDGALMVARGDGQLEWLRSPRTLIPARAIVTRLIEGPKRTIAIGSLEGIVRLISLDTGDVLYQLRLEASIEYLFLAGDNLVAVADNADYRIVDLSPLWADRCALLGESSSLCKRQR